MSDIEAQTPIELAGRSTTVREGLVGFVILLGVALAVALAALALLSRGIGEPVILAILALLAMVGMFFVFASAVGLVRVGEPTASNQVLRSLCDTMDVGVALVGQNGQIDYANPAFERILGRGARDMFQAVGSLRLADEPSARHLQRLVASARSGHAAHADINLSVGHHGQSRGRAMRLSSRPVVDAAQARSIWQLRELNPAGAREGVPLAPGLAPEAALLDRVGLGWMRLDLADRSAALSPALAAWLGLDGHRDAGSPGERRAGRELAPDLWDAIAARQGETVPLDLVTELKDASGRSRKVRAVVSFETGRSAAANVVLLPRHEAEVSLRGGRDFDGTSFAGLFETAPIGVAIVSADGKILKANDAFGKMLDVHGSPAEAGTDFASKMDGDARDAAVRALKSTMNGVGGVPPVEFSVAGVSMAGKASGKGGSDPLDGRRIGRLYFSRISYEQSGRGAAIIYAIDTTKQHELEAQFAQSQKMQAVGQLAGGIAHDFNNVLTAIIGFSDLLLGNHRPTDPAYRDIINIKQSANRAAGMVRQLLAFSRRQTLRPEVLLLTEVISDVSILLKRLISEKVELKVSHGRDLWLVKADLTQFEQVLINLAVNARDAMPEGGRLTVRTSNLEEAGSGALAELGVVPGDYVVIEVADTGTGMSQDVMDKIFEPFFSTKDVGKGTGLGLSTVYGIVKQTGGYIFCDSAPDMGTTFRIYLPRHVPPKEDEQARGELDEKRDKPRDLTGSGTVLLVEDEDAVRMFAARALSRQGYQVLEAATGAEALDAFDGADGPVDLVVSDIVMPEMDGPALLTELRMRDKDVKVIFISGYAEDALKNLDPAEKFAFLPKPFQLKELVTKVKETIGQ